MKVKIGGYNYYDNKQEALKAVKSDDDVLMNEPGLGWYLHSRLDYLNNPRKRMFGF